MSYSRTWSNAAAGTYALSARATDNLGLVSTSSVVNVTVDLPPTVSLTAPANNAVFPAPANITLTATATDSDGTVSSVEFFRGSTSLGIKTSAPYILTWSNAGAGTYALT